MSKQSSKENKKTGKSSAKLPQNSPFKAIERHTNNQTSFMANNFQRVSVQLIRSLQNAYFNSFEKDSLLKD